MGDSGGGYALEATSSALQRAGGENTGINQRWDRTGKLRYTKLRTTLLLTNLVIQYYNLSSESLDSTGKPIWDAFIDRYAHKVTSLELDTVDLRHPLMATKIPFPLLPNLHTPSIPGRTMLNVSSDEAWSRTLELVLSSSLDDVKIQPHCSSPYRLQGIMQRLVDVTPGLRRLTVHQESPEELIKVDSRQGFGAFQRLAALHVSDISFAGWKSLEGCPELRDVLLEYRGMDWVESEGLARPVVLSALCTLRINNGGDLTAFHRDYIHGIIDADDHAVA